MDFTYAPAPESRSIVDLKPSYGLFIGGEFVDGHGSSFKTISPATERRKACSARAIWRTCWSSVLETKVR